jgi:outer membrane receptor protein involved in Fe transport
MRNITALVLLLLSIDLFGQTGVSGVLTGNVLDEKNKALAGASVQLSSVEDSTRRRTVLTDEEGSFDFSDIAFGYHRLQISFVGFQPLTIDSIYFRAERYDFNLSDIILKASNSANLGEVIIYAEKPLVQSKDGNITFNAGESALSAGSSTGELLNNVPLVTKDPSGKLLVRGKEPRILIDDKPVELNREQLQDLLESMPGSSIEKIEVMTNPPAQYANAEGGVINIVTKKGRVGKSGRVSLSAGTRGQASVNGNYNYRKQGFSMNINIGAAHNNFQSEAHSDRTNIYRDSINFFRTASQSDNRNLRPSLRAQLDYEINKRHSLNLELNYNHNDFDNENGTEFRNINRLDQLYRLSNRSIHSVGANYNPAASLTYTLKTKKPGEVLRIISNANFSVSDNTRSFYQQYLRPDYSFWYDSTQQQVNDQTTRGYTHRLNYSVPFFNNKTSLSVGGYYAIANSDIKADASFKGRNSEKWEPLAALTNELRYTQYITNLRGSVKQVLRKSFSITGGLSAEATRFDIDQYTTGQQAENDYWSLLPFANLNKTWKDVVNLSVSYRRTINRPGITQLNPTIDFSDPYNLRFGNPGLLPSMAHNFDVVLGRSTKSFFVNLGGGFNKVEDIFNQIRTRVEDTTKVTWQNINSRKEYEVSTWSGYTAGKKVKMNMSASYTYNKYGEVTKDQKFRNGGTFTSNLNCNYLFSTLYNLTGNFTFNRFANPQGSVKSTLSMNMGFQAKMLEKKLTLTLNVIDPFLHQQNRVITYGSNFTLESVSTTQTRNFRLTASYSLSQSARQKKSDAGKEKQLKELTKPK